MWNADKSLMLSMISVKIFFAVGVIFCIGGYPIAKAYVTYIQRPETLHTIVITGYLCLCFAFFIFYNLHKLLSNIQKAQVFCLANEDYLRRISWMCMAVAIITTVASIGYLSFLFVAIAFAFISLIIRVVKNVIAEAILLKQENDFTI